MMKCEIRKRCTGVIGARATAAALALLLSLVVVSCSERESSPEARPIVELELSPSPVLPNVDGIYRVRVELAERGGADVTVNGGSWILTEAGGAIVTQGQLGNIGELGGGRTLRTTLPFQFTAAGYVMGVTGELTVSLRGHTASGIAVEATAAVPLTAN
ncbi:MAG: hypothetical protein HYV63_26145 [Candidatus Schekmanbacteria bacterium]|nr:hypothetical protein [Candidatus Schekmanbacteria bacterium]